MDTKNEELAYAGAGHPHPVLHSDGIVEAFGAEREMFGMDRLIGHLEMYAERSVEDALHSMLVAAADWEGKACHEDDVSMNFVEFLGPNPIPSVMDFEQTLDKTMTIR